MMRSSRLDIVPLLDIILLLFFALTLSLKKEHTKQREALAKRLHKSEQRFQAATQALERQRRREERTERSLRQLRVSHREVSKLLAQMRRVLASLKHAHQALSDKHRALQGDAKQLRAQLAKQALMLRKLRQERAQLLSEKARLEVTLRRLLLRFQALSRSEKQARAARKACRSALLACRTKLLSLKARVQLSLQIQRRLQSERKQLLRDLQRAKTAAVLWKEKHRHLHEKLAFRRRQLRKLALARDVLKKQFARLQKAHHAAHLQQRAQRDKRLLAAQQQVREVLRRNTVLQAELEMMKRDAKRLKQALKRWRKRADDLYASRLQVRATIELLRRENKRCDGALRALQLKYLRQQLFRRAERKAFREVVKRMEQREQRLNAQHDRLQASRDQMSSALRDLKFFGSLPGKEKAGLTKSMTRYLLAVFIYVQADRIVGFRRFQSRQQTRFDQPISLSRRTPEGGNLLYRSKVEPGFSAFAALDARLPADISGNKSAIYIFVFDENTSKAVTSGLEHEHQTKYKSRRVIWQL